MESAAPAVQVRRFTRIGGALYLLIILAGLWCEVFARPRVIVGGDAVETAHRLQALESLWRSSAAVELAAAAMTVGLAWCLYTLLRVVDEGLSALMLYIDLVAITLQTGFALYLLTALAPLTPATYLEVFTPEQRAALSYLAIRARNLGFGISLLFFGLVFPIRGYLILRSAFLPRLLGILVAIAGVGYVVNGFALVLAPRIAGQVFNFVAAPILLGEGSLCLWLLLRGVDVDRWEACRRGNTARSGPATT
ncbi:MAG: DUF4386 domain-containing protein [Candidatus Eisenbacteria bacterium]